MLKQFPAKQKNQKTMKKVFLTLALVLTTVVASAQWYVGGGLGFSKTEDAAKNKTTAFNINPEVGYKLNDNWTIGGVLGFEMEKDAYKMFTIAPYARYTFLTAGDFSVFADASLEVGIYKPEAGDNTTVWGLGIKPGVAYNIDENWSVAAHVGFLGYEDFDDLGNSWGLNLDNNLSFSLNNNI